ALEFGGTPGIRYLDLTRLSALKRITTSGEKLVIGALATYTELQKSRFALEFGGTPGRRYLDLTRLSALKRITTSGEKLVIGALATYTELQKSRFVRARLPMLVEAARVVGGVQIQNMGTVGGNLANASPAGDTLPVFAVADADVVLAGPEGERRVPFNAFYTGYRKSVRRADELIVAVEVPPVIG